ncbi:arylsulfatase-like protein [Coniochaeta ligniaria NRRL 30616]|uniref:Arylsulfatase n=1 Tax=Coniochaeta ligniaria NRRL 30616 TaxID=1408157 RepID=A0A1J7JZ88_9PEZI|nr:arylsulfatase-like protein [Coniochaeta ligniaria NRRL 30616]
MRGDHAPVHVRPKPNIIFILTDDQDIHLDSLQYMPLVQKHLLEKGTHFTNHYCTTAVCCPARVTLWTGKAAHNTNITDVNPPYGGYPKFVSQGFNENYLPVWLQQAGYNTYYTGKLFNAHTTKNYNSPYPAGFTGTDFLVDPFTYNYMNSSFQHNQDPPRSYEGRYSTDVLAEKAFRLLDEAVDDLDNKPFFLTIAPIAPHGNIYMNGSVLDENYTFEHGPPVAAERHRHLFQDVKVPRTANFNPDKPSGANWVSQLPQQNSTNVEYNDHFYRQRLRALQAVDEMVDGLFSRLEDFGLLDNTYIFYSSDNGFHIGQHRLQPGKSCGYEEDINIPLIIRGPGITANYSTQIVTTHTDLAPTFFDLLGIPLREDFDGTPIPATQAKIEEAYDHRREHLNVEYWGFAGGEGIYDTTLHENNTYKGIRVSGPSYNLYYSVWCTNEHELYDMAVDPGQLNNLLSPDTANSTHVAGLPVVKTVSRLDALLFVLKSCEGIICREPWKALHPAGDVTSLADALAVQFDSFYDTLETKVQYNFCANGYLIDAEGPMWQAADRALDRDGLSWDLWV